MAGAGGQEVGRISIRVVPNTDRFRSELRAQLEAIEKGLKAEIEIDPDTKGFREKVRAATSNLPDAKVKVDVDRSVLEKLRDKVGGFLDNHIGNSTGGKIPLGGFVDNLAVVAAAAAFAAPALALVSGVLVTLPALAAAVATPIAAIALGLDGIKKSAEVLKTPLDNLKASVSGAFETKLTPVFEKLGTLLPKLEGPMGTVADGLSRLASSFVDTVTSGPGMEKIQATISNIGKAIGDAAPGIATFTDGLLTLAEKVSAKFPGLSKWFNDIGTSFQGWVDKITTAGPDGKTPLDRGLTSLKDTVKEIMNLGGDLLGKGFDFLSDPKFGDKMKEFVSNIKDLVNNVLPGLANFFEDLSTFTSDIKGDVSWMKDNVPGLKDLLSSDRTRPKNKDNSDKDTGNFFEPFTSPEAPWRQVADTAGFVVTQIEGKFVLMFARVKAAGIEAIAGIGASVGPSLSAAFANIQSIAAAAWNGLVAVAANVVAQVVAQFAQVPQRLAGAWAGIPAAAAGIWNQVVAAVASALAQVVATVVSVGSQIVAEVQSWVGKITGALAGLPGALAGIGAQMIAGFLGGFRSAAAAAVGEVAAWAGKIAAAAKNALGIHSPSTVFKDIGVNTMEGLALGLDAGLQPVLDKAKALSQQLADSISSGLEGVGPGVKDQLKQSLDELELQRKNLQVQKDGIPKENKDGRKSLQDQMDQITSLKHQLGLQKDQLGFSDQYGDSVDQNTKGTDMLGDSLNKMVGIGKGFAMANANQFMSDLGMSGKGAIPTIANLGLDWASGLLSKAITGGLGGGNTNIQVNSIDEGLAAKQTIQNRKALQYKTR